MFPWEPRHRELILYKGSWDLLSLQGLRRSNEDRDALRMEGGVQEVLGHPEKVLSLLPEFVAKESWGVLEDSLCVQSSEAAILLRIVPCVPLKCPWVCVQVLPSSHCPKFLFFPGLSLSRPWGAPQSFQSEDTARVQAWHTVGAC